VGDIADIVNFLEPLPNPSPRREGLEIQLIKSTSLLGEGDFGGEAEKLKD
jgi:hypothetical protein